MLWTIIQGKLYYKVKISLMKSISQSILTMSINNCNTAVMSIYLINQLLFTMQNTTLHEDTYVYKRQ